jgi:hypothetical protein
MSEWIKTETHIHEKVEVAAIAEHTGLDAAKNRISAWFSFHTLNGKTNLIAKKTIDQICGAVGSCDALIDLGCISHDGDFFKFNLFDRSTLHYGKRFSIPATFIRAIYERDQYRCVYCGFKSSKENQRLRRGELSADHIKPITRMPRQAIEDLATACIWCNMEKTNRTPEEFGLLPTFLSDQCRYETQMILGGNYGI